MAFWITHTKILCIVSKFFLFSLSKGLFYRTFQWEVFSQVLRHLKYCLKYQFPFNKWSTKHWLTYRPDRVGRAADFGCKCVWDGLLPYFCLVSLEDFAVVFFPSHQMHVRGVTSPSQPLKGCCLPQEQLSLVAQGGKGHCPSFKLLFFTFEEAGTLSTGTPV